MINIKDDNYKITDNFYKVLYIFFYEISIKKDENYMVKLYFIISFIFALVINLVHVVGSLMIEV